MSTHMTRRLSLILGLAAGLFAAPAFAQDGDQGLSGEGAMWVFCTGERGCGFVGALFFWR